jgi:electron transfer flavoprotein alpha subunit
MSRLLVLAETDGAAIQPQTTAVVSFAQVTGLPFDILVLGQGVSPEPVAGFGAEKVLVADDPRLAKPLGDRYAAVASEVVTKGAYTHAACTSTTFGRDVLPRVAGLLQAPMLSDVLSVVSLDEGTYTRPMYAGAAIATVKIEGSPALLTVRATEFAPPEQQGQSAVEQVSVGDLPQGLEWVELRATSTGRPDLTQARVVVSGGRPLKDAETFNEHVAGLADLLGGAVGATRAAVDAGIVGNDLQVGQTGKVVAPELYIAAGISGSTQHLAGMTGSKVIVAINKDPEAPIFEVADYGLVADLFKAIPELKAKLQDLPSR